MRFEPIPYMQWAKSHPGFSDPETMNLASSGMHPLAADLTELGLDPGQLDLHLSTTNGHGPLVEAIAARYGVRPGKVLTGQGASMVNFLLYAVLLNPGDILLAEQPVYECLTAPPRALGARVVPFQRNEAERWALPHEDLRSLAYASGAAGVMLTNPHNPTGQVTTDEELVELADALGPDRFVIVDEIYREWLPDQAGRTAALAAENIYVTSSLTKVFGLPALRMGWAIASSDVVKRARQAYDHMGVNEPGPSAWIAEQLFAEPSRLNRLRERSLAELAEGRKKVDGLLKSMTGRKLKVVMPPAGGYAFLRSEALDGDELARRLYEEQKVLVTPGSFFGSRAHVRISWTRGLDQVEEGLTRIGYWLRNQMKG